MSTPRQTSRVAYWGPFSSALAGGAPPVSPVGGAGIYAEADTGEALLSINGGPWLPISTSVVGGSGWTDDGTVVRLTTATDQVGVGTAAPAAGEKMHVLSTQTADTRALVAELGRSGPMGAGESQTAIVVTPNGDAGDDVNSFTGAIWAQPPVGPSSKQVLFIQGNQAGGSFWTNTILCNDNDMSLVALRQTAGAPNNIVIETATAAGGASGTISIGTGGGIPGLVRGRWDENGSAVVTAYAREGQVDGANGVLVASTNNWAPTDLATSSAIYASQATGGNVNLTGLTGGRRGRRITLWNVSADPTDTITLTHDDAASAAANQFSLPQSAPIVLEQFGAVELVYDIARTRWRVIQPS
jgi:hypothetical protein